MQFGSYDVINPLRLQGLVTCPNDYRKSNEFQLIIVMPKTYSYKQIAIKIAIHLERKSINMVKPIYFFLLIMFLIYDV